MARPQWLFDFARMPRSNYPEIFACLGMVIGLYGILYWQVARDPEHGRLIAAVGLAGKGRGPIGPGPFLVRGSLAKRSIVVFVTKNFLWWIPFALYLIDSSKIRRCVPPDRNTY